MAGNHCQIRSGGEDLVLALETFRLQEVVSIGKGDKFPF